jgi:hypothetical protein
MTRQELLRKINSCGDCKDNNHVKGVVIMCDKHWKESKQYTIKKEKIIKDRKSDIVIPRRLTN